MAQEVFMTEVGKKMVTLPQFKAELSRLGLNPAQVTQVTDYVNQFLKGKGKKFEIRADKTVEQVTRTIMDNWPRYSKDRLKYGAITKLPSEYLPTLVPKAMPPTQLPTPVRVSGKPTPVVQSTASVFKYDLRIIPKGLFARSEVYSITSSAPVTIENIKQLIDEGKIREASIGNKPVNPQTVLMGAISNAEDAKKEMKLTKK